VALSLPVRRPAPATGIARGAPLTVATLLALAVTTTTLLGVRGRGAHLLAVGASTNLHNLESHPLDVLFISTFWVETAWLFWPVAALVVGVLGLSERRIGSWRTLGVFAAGHVGATLVTVAGVAVGVAHGWLPRELTHAVDVGPSYGLAAVAAVGGVLAIRPADESVPVPLARGFEQHRDVDTYNAVAAPSVTGRRHSRMACSQRLLTPMTGPAQRT